MSTETYEFIEATPVKRLARKGAGRRAEVNPFLEAVKAVAGQADAEGNPLARASAFTLDAEHGETLKQRHGKIRRSLTKAAKEITPAGEDHYSITMVIERLVGASADGPDTYVVKFWDRNVGK